MERAGAREAGGNWPRLGPSVPARGGRLSRAIGRTACALLGWRIEGEVPDIPRCVVIVAPHTSNWDLPIGISLMLALGIRVHWLGKHTIFRPPQDRLLRWLGGIPVDRRAPGAVVAHVAVLLRDSRQMFLGLAPEGTRRRVARWKTGFYWIAVNAGVPIVTVAFDFPRRRAVIWPPFAPTGDLEVDLAVLKSRFRAAMARHPEWFA